LLTPSILIPLLAGRKSEEIICNARKEEQQEKYTTVEAVRKVKGKAIPLQA
jgi:hypothetical protein